MEDARIAAAVYVLSKPSVVFTCEPNKAITLLVQLEHDRAVLFGRGNPKGIE